MFGSHRRRILGWVAHSRSRRRFCVSLLIFVRLQGSGRFIRQYRGRGSLLVGRHWSPIATVDAPEARNFRAIRQTSWASLGITAIAGAAIGLKQKTASFPRAFMLCCRCLAAVADYRLAQIPLVNRILLSNTGLMVPDRD